MTEKDAAELFVLRSDDQVMQYVDKEKMESLHNAIALIQNIDEARNKGDGISWGICLHEDERVIGYAGIWRIDKENHRGEIGYTLHPGFWNKGIMSEVVQEIIRFGFDQVNLHSLEANINPENAASMRLLEKLGFVREAYFRENYYFRGKFLDSVIYSLVNK